MAGADRLISRHKVSLIMTLPVTYGPRMEAIDGVDLATHWTWFNGIYQDEPKNFFGSFPVEPISFLEMYPEYTLPEDQLKAWLNTRTGAVVGTTLVERFQWKIGDRIPLKSPIWPREGDEAWEFDIVGIYGTTENRGDPSGFFFRYDYFDEGRVNGKGEVGCVVEQLASGVAHLLPYRP